MLCHVSQTNSYWDGQQIAELDIKVAEHSFYLIEMRYPSLLVMLTS